MQISKPVRHKPDNPFPVTAKDDVQPTDPRDEPSREWVNSHPEGLTERMERTRRYYRLTHKALSIRYANGLGGKQSDFA